MGYVSGENRDQGALFPVRLDELIPGEHFCRVIEAFVKWLDLGTLGFERSTPDVTGRPAYDPADLLKLYLYGYLQQLRSSRRLERECQRNVEVMWLLNRLAPDHKTIAEFRRRNGAPLRQAGGAFVRFCAETGLVRGQWVAIDGSRFQAVASPKAVLSRAQLAREREAVERQISQYLAELDTVDAAETMVEVDTAATRSALTQLQAEQANLQRAERLLKTLEVSHYVTSEPEARPLRGPPAYNVQSAVDAEHGLIVAHAVTDEATDNRSLQPMAEAACAALGVETLNVVADAGYSSGAQAAALEARGILTHVPVNRSVNSHGDGELFDRTAFTYQPEENCFRCPAGQRLTLLRHQPHKHRSFYVSRAADCARCPLKPRCTQAPRRHVSRHWHEAALNRMQARATPQMMALRQRTVEYPFGALKYQIFEKPRFLLRGLWGAGTEMAIATLVYNLKRAINILGATRLQTALA